MFKPRWKCQDLDPSPDVASCDWFPAQLPPAVPVARARADFPEGGGRVNIPPPSSHPTAWRLATPTGPTPVSCTCIKHFGETILHPNIATILLRSRYPLFASVSIGASATDLPLFLDEYPANSGAWALSSSEASPSHPPLPPPR